MDTSCRTDNGRALARIAKPAGENHAYLQFLDGKVYRVSPVSDLDLFHLGKPETMPGCWWNKTLRMRRRFTAQRLDAFPAIPSTGWLFVIWSDKFPF